MKGNDDVQATNGDEDIISQEVNMEEEEEEEEEVEEEDDDDDGEDDDADDLLIPNLAVRDRDDLFFAGNFPSWSAGSSGDGGGWWKRIISQLIKRKSQFLIIIFFVIKLDIYCVIKNIYIERQRKKD